MAILFKNFFSHKETKQESNTLTPEISSAITSVIGRRSIPTMAGSAHRAFKLSIDPNASARDFIEVIEGDESLSAKVIKIANSVFFDRGHRSETIEACVNIVGINELRNLLSATTLSDIFPSRNPARLQFWLNDIATALAAKILGERIGHPKKDAAFLGGLLHDIGKLLLLQRVERDYCDIIDKAKNHERGFCGAEEEVFLFNHTEVGQLIAEKWNFSSDLKDMIRYHHTAPDLENQSEITLANLIWAADIMAHALGIGHPRNFGAMQNRANEEVNNVLKFLGIPLTEKRDVLQEIQRTFDFEKDVYLHPGSDF